MRRIIYIFLLSLAAVSCKLVEGIQDTATELFRGEIVARAGEHKLYRSQLKDYIPSGVSAEDSTSLARHYIEAWAQEVLLLDLADEQLSEEEKDVSKELEDYRRSLLKYRYEQRYIDHRLDTLITDEEIEAYYKANPARFRLDRPLMKARYLVIPASSKSLKKLRRLMSSDDDADLVEAGTLAATAAIKYVDASDNWMDAITLAQELGTDYRTLVKAIRSQFAELSDGLGNLQIAYIVEYLPEGKTAPLEYCRGRVRDLILSTRKHSLEVALQEEILQEAKDNDRFVIY